MSNQKFENVEALLKALKRPATSYELVIAMNGVKERRSVFSELKTLLKNGSVRKISIPVHGYDGEITLYFRQSR